MKKLIILLLASVFGGGVSVAQVTVGNGTLYTQTGNVQYSASASTQTASLAVVIPNASSTGTVITSAASATADSFDTRNSAGTNLYRIGPQGHVLVPTYTKAQVDTLVPDFQGAMIRVTNYSFLGATASIPGALGPSGSYVLCTATGTAVSQWAVDKSTNGVQQNGCGTNQ